MKIVSRKTLLLLPLAALLLASCAKKETEDTSGYEAMALKAWMETWVPQAEEHDGIYTIVETANPGAAKLSEGYWAEIEYTGYTLPVTPVMREGTVFVTRDEATSKMALASNPYRTHYAVEKVWVSATSTMITEAMYKALMMMGELETWLVYAPSSLTYGSTGSTYSYGYQGQSALGGGKPCYMRITLKRIIPDVEADEQTQVKTYAETVMGLGDDNRLEDYFYLQKVPNNASAAEVASTDKVQVYYVGRLLDGFVFDTNIDSVALNTWGTTTSYSALSYTPDSDKSSYITAWYEAITNMQYDSWGHMVFTSEYGYSYSGNTPASGTYGTVIGVYEPLHFDLYIAPKASDTNVDFSANLLDKGWTRQQVAGTQAWGWASGAVSIAGGGTANECWLISPSFNFTAYSYLSLSIDHKVTLGDGSNDNMEIWVSKANPALPFDQADWTKLSLTSFPSAYGSSNTMVLTDWVASPNLRIALRYKSAVPTTSAWSVDGMTFYTTEE